ncbi:hypothetical protein PM082_013996 [Marasmius tenuissimus]|nr:hypothetical protein PM082_013996 [Marasmius tenuissimus]
MTFVHLHSLTLTSASSPESIAALLDSVTLPALRALKASPVVFERTTSSIARLLRRSSCSLNTLALDGAADELLIDLLNVPEIHNLRVLSIGGPWNSVTGHYLGISDTVLTQFQVVKTEQSDIQAVQGLTVLLPHLEEMILTGPRRWTKRTLVDLLSSRRNVDQKQAFRLRKITLQMGDDDFDVEDESAMN